MQLALSSDTLLPRASYLLAYCFSPPPPRCDDVAPPCDDVAQARLQEIKRELLHSKKLSAHFEANPDDLEMLRHDRPLSTARKQPQLAHVPAYLKPDTEGATESVSMVGHAAKRIKDRSKRRLYGKGKKGKVKDPLRHFQGGGRIGKKTKNGGKKVNHVKGLGK